MTLLLDANVLIALVNRQHVHHERARTWFASNKPPFATCAITQGALVRHYFRETDNPKASEVTKLIQDIEAMSEHSFWSDEISYSQIDYRAVIGHRQVTDAYLIALARARKGKLATMDRGISLLYPDYSIWIETTAA